MHPAAEGADEAPSNKIYVRRPGAYAVDILIGASPRLDDKVDLRPSRRRSRRDDFDVEAQRDRALLALQYLDTYIIEILCK